MSDDDTDPKPIVFKVLGPTEQATQAVYVRSKWSDPWVLVPDLHCDSLTLAAAPSIGTASFSFRYGQRLQSGSSTWSSVSRAVFNPRSYVRVVVTPTEGLIPNTEDPDDFEPTPIEWIGIWRTAVDFGLHQRFSADAIEALLISTVRDSFYYDTFGGIQRARCAMTFNDRGKPNRTATKQPVVGGNAYIFDANPDRSSFWTTRQIVEYLLAAHPPLKSDGTEIFRWYLISDDVLPDYDRPTLATQGKDVLTLLHALISRYRLMSFHTKLVNVSASGPTPATTVVAVKPFTFTNAEISMSDLAGTNFFLIPENPSQFTLDFRKDPSSSASLSIAANHVADRVTVIGGTRISVCSLSRVELSLNKGWKPLHQAEYVNAESALAFELPSDTERREREAMIRQFRASRKYAEVFARFIVDPFWSQKAKNGEGEGDENPIALDDDDETQYQIPQNLIRLSDELPFLTGYEYGDEIIADAQEANTPGHRGTKVGEKPFVNLPMLVALKRTDDPERYIPLEAVGQLAELETQEISGDDFEEVLPVHMQWSGAARVIRDEPAFVIDVNNGYQHVLAASEFALKPDRIQGAFAWEQMIVTVAIEDPRKISVSYPPLDAPSEGEEEEGEVAFVPLGEFINEKLIEVGPEYKLIYVVPQTVVEVSPLGELVRSTGGYLQDDRDYLKLIAQRTYEWYKQPRYALTFGTGFIDGQLTVGAYITSIRDGNRLLSVGSVITEITIEFPKSRGTQSPSPKVMYSTAFAELDPTKMAG